MNRVIISGETWKPSVHIGYRHFKTLKTHSQVPIESGEATVRCEFVPPLVPPLPSSALLGMVFTRLSLGLLIHTEELRMPRSQGYCDPKSRTHSLNSSFKRHFLSVSRLPDARNIPAFSEPIF